MKFNFIRSGGNDRRKSLGTPGRFGHVPEKIDAQLAKTDAKLDRIAEMLGGVSNNQGKIAEEFFYNSLKHNPVLVGKQFDSVFRNVVGSTRESQEEYDILLFNGDSVFIIEVKYRVHPKDIETLIKRKGGSFPLLLPQYRDFQRHLGLATFSIEDAALQEARSGNNYSAKAW